MQQNSKVRIDRLCICSCAIFALFRIYPLLLKFFRIVVQANPPFLAVHTNAAYCRLTGLGSHMVVGKSIRALMSIDRSSRGLHVNAEDTQDSGNQSIADTAKNESSKQSLKDVTLEQLIVQSCFGHIYTVQVHRKLLHQMVGRSVVISKNGTSTGRDGEESNNSASFASTCTGVNGDREPFTCQISIAPIVSAAVAVNYVVGREAEVSFQKSKRAKHHHGSVAEQQEADGAQHGNKSATKAASVPCHRKGSQTPQIVTHYVIQLHPHGIESYEGSMESLSSDSAAVEARLLDLSTEQPQHQRDAANFETREIEMLEMDESVSDEATSGAKEPVAAIG